MGASPEELANQDYEAKMALAFAEYYPVLRDDGVMTVQFNHKDSGAWDVLAYSLIEAGFAITASWTVSTENPQTCTKHRNNASKNTPSPSQIANFLPVTSSMDSTPSSPCTWKNKALNPCAAL